MKISTCITDRDAKGSYFTAKFVAQGCYDREIKGYFRHYEDYPSQSTWDVEHLNNFGKVNGLTHYPVDEILSLLGNGCMDIGTDLLDEMLTPKMDDDYSEWIDWRENEDRQAENEEILNQNFYRKQVGF